MSKNGFVPVPSGGEKFFLLIERQWFISCKHEELPKLVGDKPRHSYPQFRDKSHVDTEV
jgi:hypothetical protein